MPTILFTNEPDVSSQDVMTVAIFAEYVGNHCFDVFADDGSRSRSETLSLRAQEVSDALDFGDEPHFSRETIQKIIDLRSVVADMCFDKFGDPPSHVTLLPPTSRAPVEKPVPPREECLSNLG